MSGCVGNFANSPLPTADPANPGAYTGGIRKFVDSLPGLGAANANNLGQYLPVAIPDTTTYTGSDYYEISLVEYTEQMHSDLPATKLRGYKQTNTTDATVSVPHYLGPVIVATKDRPVRIKFKNELPTGAGGNLFIPTDTTAMGAGAGPNGTNYSQNRATLHLHGGNTPWISDGTPHQWTTPAGEVTDYPKGVSVSNVPDMPAPGAGELTFFYTNQQSARLMFYHDHAYGITRLNVYAGEAAGYILQDSAEQALINGGTVNGVTVAAGTIPADQIPLIIQDKTFVPDTAQLTMQDPTWDIANWGSTGSLWFPHVYMPNQNPADLSGANAMGRYDYGPWFWPVWGPDVIAHADVACPSAALPTQTCPGTPNPSLVPEGFMDTAVVNGTAYPTLNVSPKAYRLRILNAANDRFLNLQFYTADPSTVTADGRRFTEVKMVPAVATAGFPATWPTDGRAGGVPDPTTAGPSFVQIGTEGGFLPAPVTISSQPVGYNFNRRDIVVLNVQEHALYLGPAERADAIVDFSAFAGQTLILYNDAPAPVPAADPRFDYFTGSPDTTDTGGTPSTVVGYGPNTRTIMQIHVAGGGATPYAHSSGLAAALAAAYATTQPATPVPDGTYGRIQSTSMNFTPEGEAVARQVDLEPKAIQELFELEYGRMNATMGVEMPHTNFTIQTTIPLGYVDPLTETLQDAGTDPINGLQLWKITHNGVDTHAVHFHLFNVQLVNRVGWDGAIRPPDSNELGWKETVKMNPLEDVIVAMRPIAPELPFGVPDSSRPLDPTKAVGSTITVTNPANGNFINVVNAMTDFGWEYVWHCHLLGHEENDMMRPLKYDVTTAVPPAPTGLAMTVGAGVTLTWTDPTIPPAVLGAGLINPQYEIGFRIERRTGAGAWGSVGTALANATTFTDSTAVPGTTYTYRVIAYNASGDSLAATTGAADTGIMTPVVVWANPSPIVYGTALSATQLNASSTVAGTFVYTPPSGTVLAAGSQTLSVTFTPTNPALYSAVTKTVTLTVAGASAGVTWATPSPIVYGTALSATQLNATAAVPGTFVYTPAAGTVPNPGVQTLSVTFTPTDVNYPAITATVSQVVFGAVTISPTSLAFAGTSAGVTTAAQTVYVFTSAAQQAWQAESNVDWLVVTNGTGTGTGQFTASVDMTGLPTTPATLTATILIQTPGTDVLEYLVPVTLQIGAGTAAPFGTLDTPANGATNLSGMLSVTGWALDDVGVDRVEIWRDWVAGEAAPPYPGGGLVHGKVYVGRATFTCSARPDVLAAFPTYPQANCAGWGMMLLTYGLPNGGNGTYTLHAFAYDLHGAEGAVGSSTIQVNNTVNNRPFGALDTPTPEETVAGAFWNNGWALTPNATPTCTILSNGVNLLVDSRPLVPVTYGLQRADVTAAFPGYSNSYLAGGGSYLDTTALTNGSHQISWIVSDDCGRQDAIGSRNFIVMNMASPVPAAVGGVVPLPASAFEPAASGLNSRAVGVSANGGAFETALPTTDGVRVIQVDQGARIEVLLPRAAGATYAGYEVTGDQLHGLPFGSSLDAAAGVFYWQPGASFLGTYDLLFTPSTGAGSVRIRVVVGPPIRMAVDSPQAGTVDQQPLVVAGWAVDLAAESGTGIDAVHVWAEPADGAVAVFLGAATYGGARPDVSALFGPQFERASYGLTVPSLDPGTYDVIVYVHRASTGTFDAAQKVRIEVR